MEGRLDRGPYRFEFQEEAAEVEMWLMQVAKLAEIWDFFQKQLKSDIGKGGGRFILISHNKVF